MMKRMFLATVLMIGCVAAGMTSCGGNDSANDAVEQAEQQQTETISEYQTLLTVAMDSISNDDGGYWSKLGQYEFATKWMRKDNADYRVEVYVNKDDKADTNKAERYVNILVYRYSTIVCEFPTQKVEGSYMTKVATGEKMTYSNSKETYDIYNVDVYIPSIKDKKGAVAKGLRFKYHGTLPTFSMLEY